MTLEAAKAETLRQLHIRAEAGLGDVLAASFNNWGLGTFHGFASGGRKQIFFQLAASSASMRAAACDTVARNIAEGND